MEEMKEIQKKLNDFIYDLVSDDWLAFEWEAYPYGELANQYVKKIEKFCADNLKGVSLDSKRLRDSFSQYIDKCWVSHGEVLRKELEGMLAESNAVTYK